MSAIVFMLIPARPNAFWKAGKTTLYSISTDLPNIGSAPSSFEREGFAFQFLFPDLFLFATFSYFILISFSPDPALLSHFEFKTATFLECRSRHLWTTHNSSKRWSRS